MKGQHQVRINFYSDYWANKLEVQSKAITKEITVITCGKGIRVSGFFGTSRSCPTVRAAVMDVAGSCGLKHCVIVE